MTSCGCRSRHAISGGILLAAVGLVLSEGRVGKGAVPTATDPFFADELIQRRILEMRAERLISRCFRMEAAVLGALFYVMTAASALCAETLEGCSWAGLDLDWTLDRILPEVDLAGSLGSEVIDLLHEAGAPISFISRATEDPEVRFQRSEPITIRELLDEVMAQTPGYRLDDVGGKLVIYPFDEDFDALVDLGDLREATRAGAWISVFRELHSNIPKLAGLQTVLRGTSLGPWSDLISVGGVRTVVEHLASLIADSPSATFTIAPWTDGVMYLNLGWVDVIEDLLLEAPKKVELGKEFQVVPRLILAGGTPVTLIGSGCGVQYQASDESILEIDQEGRGVAIAKGESGIFAIYEDEGVYVNVEVTED